MKQILIIDDDKTICSLLHKFFLKHSIYAFYAVDTIEAKKILDNFFCNLIILDYMLPNQNGYDFLQELRKKKNDIFVIMLTAKHEEDDKILCLEHGADDYILKPFNTNELLFKVKNTIERLEKRSNQLSLLNQELPQNEIVLQKNVKILIKEQSIIIKDCVVYLTDVEMNLLLFFVKNIGKIVEKEDILMFFNKAITIENINNVNVSIFRLRKKLSIHDNELIKNIRNKGYTLVC